MTHPQMRVLSAVAGVLGGILFVVSLIVGNSVVTPDRRISLDRDCGSVFRHSNFLGTACTDALGARSPIVWSLLVAGIILVLAAGLLLMKVLSDAEDERIRAINRAKLQAEETA